MALSMALDAVDAQVGYVIATAILDRNHVMHFEA